jgi:hypothetical protein
MADPPKNNNCELDASADAGLSSSALPIISLCGFNIGLPSFVFSFGFKLPKFDFKLPFPPLPNLTLSCDLANPIGASWGGGRFSTALPCADESNQPDSEDQ